MKAKGFTLGELLIVIAIIMLLAAIAIPGFLKAKEEAEKMAQSKPKKVDKRMERIIERNRVPLYR